MASVKAWCYTVAAGILFCGIIMILVPGERYRRPMQMVLALFLFSCIFSFGRLSVPELDIKKDEAEQKRLRSAESSRLYFLDRVLTQTEETVEDAIRALCSEAGINAGDIQIYIETVEDGALPPAVTVVLPGKYENYSRYFYKALSYQLGIDVVIEVEP